MFSKGVSINATITSSTGFLRAPITLRLRMALIGFLPSVCLSGRTLVNLFHVLCVTVAIRPVLFWHFNQIYTNILSSKLYTLVQTVCEGPVEALFQLNRAAAVQCDLQENAVV